MRLLIPKNFLIFLSTSLLICFLVIDNLIINFPIFSIVNRDSFIVKVIFILIISMTIISITNYIKKGFQYHQKPKFKNPFQLFVFGTIALLIISMLVVVTEIISSKSYHTFSIKMVVILSGILQIGSLGFLMFNIIRWLQFARENIIKLLFIVTISLFATSMMILIYNSLSLERSPSLITYDKLTVSSSVLTYDTLEIYYWISYSVSFILMWTFSFALLTRYLKKSNKIRFWIVLFIPLVYFLGRSELIDFIFSILNISSPILYFQLLKIVESSSNLLGSVIFGFSFWIISKNISISLLKKYTNLFSIGIVLFFLSHQISPITIIYYPPFGLASTAIMGISSFIISLSMYSIALIISFDKTLQLYLTKSGSFLGNIGLAQMYQSINKRITNLNEKIIEFNENYNILTGNDIQNYLKVAIKEKEKNVIDLAKHSLGYTKEEDPLGKSWSKWIELWWKWYYHHLNDHIHNENPNLLCCKGQIYDPIWFLLVTFDNTVKRICTIPHGKSLFFPIVSNIIPFAPYTLFKTENELYAYAKLGIDQTNNFYLKIDGKDLTNILIYRVHSELFSIALNMDPSQKVGNDNYVLTNAISDGYWVFLKPLGLGRHTIEFGGEKLDNDKTNSNIKSKIKFRTQYEIDII